jgi:hypothetical protein
VELFIPHTRAGSSQDNKWFIQIRCVIKEAHPAVEDMEMHCNNIRCALMAQYNKNLVEQGNGSR